MAGPRGGAVQSAAEGAASGAPAGPGGAVPQRRDHGALRLPAVLLVQQGGAVRIADPEGGHAQTVTVTVLETGKLNQYILLSGGSHT